MPAGRTKADAKRDGGNGEDDAVAKARMAADGTDTFMAAVWHFGTLTTLLLSSCHRHARGENKTENSHRRSSSPNVQLKRHRHHDDPCRCRRHALHRY